MSGCSQFIRSGILRYRLIIARITCSGLYVPRLVQRVRTIYLDSFVTRRVLLSNFWGILILLLKLKDMSTGRTTITPETRTLTYGR
ncbi:hypothetical protein HanPI659440_Chr03g0102831 [Helianthus annuus]|nr:hypothetical protein HanPI659440_Chr03g0102831 [Helianthus annuus]